MARAKGPIMVHHQKSLAVPAHELHIRASIAKQEVDVNGLLRICRAHKRIERYLAVFVRTVDGSTSAKKVVPLPTALICAAVAPIYRTVLKD